MYVMLFRIIICFITYRIIVKYHYILLYKTQERIIHNFKLISSTLIFILLTANIYKMYTNIECNNAFNNNLHLNRCHKVEHIQSINEQNRLWVFGLNFFGYIDEFNILFSIQEIILF